MKLALQPIDLDAIRTDGGTQVRERLEDAWVQELMQLYDDGGHDIDPILVMVDPEGSTWLVDGFHRVDALRRLGWGATPATVRHGSLEAAKLLAARMNKNGLPRTPGDKKRAVLLALSTAEGKKMGLRELARHCGVAHSWAAEIIGMSAVVGSDHGMSTNDTQRPRQKAVAVLWARVDLALHADPGRPDTDIAREVGCHYQVVNARRAKLGLPKSDTKRRRTAPSRDRARDLLREHTDWSNRRIAQEAGSSPETVAKLRSAAGLRAPSRKPAPRLRIVDNSADQRAENSAQFKRLLTEALELPRELRAKLVAQLEESLRGAA